MATKIFHPSLYEKDALKNFWVGNDEYILSKLDEDVYIVKESDYHYIEVYRGDYESCVDYIQQQFINYQEERIG